MEIIKGYSSTIKFPVPSTLSNATSTVKRDGVQIGSLRQVSPSGGIAEVPIPYAATTTEGTLEVTLTFTFESTTHNLSKHVDVTTPYLEEWEVLEIVSDVDVPSPRTLEASVRHIINAHTGQEFGKFVGTLKVRGTNNGSLQLPRRLMRTNLVNGYSSSFYAITGDGFYLSYYPDGVPPVRADYYGLHMHRGGIIHNPNHVRMGSFLDSQVYEIHGEWGYDEVPGPIKEAAALLVNDYASEDTAYRDRYLTSMTAADWRIQFNSGAFAKTGNVRADQLLSEYVLQRGWAVL